MFFFNFLFLWSNGYWQFDLWSLCLFWIHFVHLEVLSSCAVGALLEGGLSYLERSQFLEDCCDPLIVSRFLGFSCFLKSQMVFFILAVAITPPDFLPADFGRESPLVSAARIWDFPRPLWIHRHHTCCSPLWQILRYTRPGADSLHFVCPSSELKLKFVVSPWPVDSGWLSTCAQKPSAKGHTHHHQECAQRDGHSVAVWVGEVHGVRGVRRGRGWAAYEPGGGTCRQGVPSSSRQAPWSLQHR